MANLLSCDDFPAKGDLNAQALFALEFAVRSPSTHNSQPWLFRIEDDRISIFGDLSRKLPFGDKDGRDFYISLGACIENLRLALSYFTMLKHVEYGPQGESAPVAVFIIQSSQGYNESLVSLVRAIPLRFNARGPFTDAPLRRDVLEQITAISETNAKCLVREGRDEIKAFAELTAGGMIRAHGDKQFRKELSQWMRHNYSSRRDGIPGYAMLAPGWLSFLLPHIVGNFNTGPVLAKKNKEAILSCRAIGVIETDTETPRDWVSAGMLFERIALSLTASGACASIFVATIEIPDLRKELGKRLGIPRMPQFSFAMGYPKFSLKLSPRHAPRARMI